MYILELKLESTIWPGSGGTLGKQGQSDHFKASLGDMARFCFQRGEEIINVINNEVLSPRSP